MKKYGEQTEYEKGKGLVSRGELIKNVVPMMKNLDDGDFHSLYALLWSLDASKLLLRIERDKNYKV